MRILVDDDKSVGGSPKRWDTYWKRTAAVIGGLRIAGRVDLPHKGRD
jgi:hypothetical protein